MAPFQRYTNRLRSAFATKGACHARKKHLLPPPQQHVHERTALAFNGHSVNETLFAAGPTSVSAGIGTASSRCAWLLVTLTHIFHAVVHGATQFRHVVA
jgi:hypothetical protein